MGSCYGSRLNTSRFGHTLSVQRSNRIWSVCLEHFSSFLLFLFAAFLLTAPTKTRAQAPSSTKANLPAKDEIKMYGVLQDSNNEWRHVKGAAKIETSEILITADDIQYNSDTHWAYAKGHVHMEMFSTGDKMNADHGEFNLETEEGRFYNIDGTAPAKVMTAPWVLTTSNPFYFKAAWADRIKTRYILHHGFVTDCTLPKPWWTFNAPVFDIIPGNRAKARRAMFRLKGIPLLYLPYFARPLGRSPRQSGFLTPNVGHTTQFGYVYAAGYYLVLGRSYDMTGLAQYFTQRGPAFSYDFRGKPNLTTDFDFNYYTVRDRGIIPTGSTTVEKQGGTEFELTGKTSIWGFSGRFDYNYLSSFLFRQIFSYSFATYISNEVNSIAFLQRRFDKGRYTVNIVAQRDQLFEASTLLSQPPDQVVIQKLPSLEASSRDQQILGGNLPVWFSFGASAALLDRQEPGPENNTSKISNTGFLDRLDVDPRVSTALRFKGFTLVPSIALEATQYGNSYSSNSDSSWQLAGKPLFRRDVDVVIDFQLPPLERIFTPPKWLHMGVKLKHVIETDATYEYLTGVDQFNKIIHFDGTDVIANTSQATFSVTNRLLKKDKKGNVSELVTWRLAQARYFNSTFGGAVISGQVNTVYAIEEITPFTFLSGPRTYSPIVSYLVVNPGSIFSMDWRSEYDPLQHKFVDNFVNAGVRVNKYYFGIGESSITTLPLLIPNANQMTFSAGFGNTNRRGFNVGGLVDIDLLNDQILYEFIQTSYNSNCCGFSFQLRSFNLGPKVTNEYLFSFAVANLGTFGSMQRQDRIF